MSEAIQAYRHITVTPEFREAERLRTKARHDEAQALFNKACEIAKNLLAMAMSADQISAATGLTHAEIEILRNAD